VNHTGWLSKRGADTAAAETLAEVDGSDPILLTMEAEMFWQKAWHMKAIKLPLNSVVESSGCPSNRKLSAQVQVKSRTVISARTGPDTREATTVGKRLSS